MPHTHQRLTGSYIRRGFVRTPNPRQHFSGVEIASIQKTINTAGRSLMTGEMMLKRLGVFTFALVCLVFCVTPVGHARVDGEPHALYAQHRLFGGVVTTGNTLMTQSVVAPQVNSVLLPQSAGDVRGLPFDAELEGAYLFWS